MADLTDDEILDELGLDAEPKKESRYSHEEARVIAGFEDIVRFVDEHGRKPEHGQDRDIFERLYAVRLDRIRGNPTFRALVADLDTHELLAGASDEHTSDLDDTDDDALLEELGLDAEAEDSISTLKHVKPRAEVQTADEVASRKPCKDFARFKPLFAEVQNDLDTGRRETRQFVKDASIDKGEFFILSGQMAYVANVGEEEHRTKAERADRRLRVIYDNGTESDILMRSLQRALYKDETGRRIIDPHPGPLFGSSADVADMESGTIYVLRSTSDHPVIAQSRDLVHKIGVTGGDVERRIASAKDDPTFLFADVTVVATYKLFNVNRSKLESVLHRVLAPARLDLEMPDRFGKPVRAREWFLVPLSVIDDVVAKVRDQSITEYVYHPQTAALKKR